MPDSEVITIIPVDMLALSIIVVFTGMFLTTRIRILRDNYIPPAVTGGLLFALAATALRGVTDVQFDFDMRGRDLLLLAFFSTVGLSARFRTVLAGGKPLLILSAVTAVLLLMQNVVGLTTASAAGYHPAYGLMAGSVPFAGGHGTAIAWGEVAREAGFEAAAELGLVLATFGLVAGGLLGGPIARRLIERHNIETPTVPGTFVQFERSTEDDADWLYHVLLSLLALSLCVSLGDMVNRALMDYGVRLPGFLTAMTVGVLLTNLADGLGKPLNAPVIERFGEVSLHMFLAQSMMAVQLWALAEAYGVILAVLALQVLLMAGFAVFVVFRLMGKNYDAAVIAAGFTGLGLGATPVAMANMDAVTTRYGPCQKAFIVVPIVGALVLDLINAGTVTFFGGLVGAWSP